MLPSPSLPNTELPDAAAEPPAELELDEEGLLLPPPRGMREVAARMAEEAPTELEPAVEATEDPAPAPESALELLAVLLEPEEPDREVFGLT